MRKLIIALILVSLSCLTAIAEELYNKNLMIAHPEWYIKIPDWSVYAGWSCPAIIHHVREYKWYSLQRYSNQSTLLFYIE